MHEIAYFMHEIAVNTKSVNHQIRPLFWCIFAKNTQKTPLLTSSRVVVSSSILN